MLGYVLAPATTESRRVPLANFSGRRETTVLSVQILPDGTPLDGAFVYARKEDCAFSLDDPTLYAGFNAHVLRQRPRVSFDLVEGRAVNVELVQ
jgi:hypothetical protein